MRMWMVDPKILCRNHLLGEHLELHILASKLNEGRKIAGFIAHGLVDPTLVSERHEELVKEMQRRGYKHASPMAELPEKREKGRVDPEANMLILTDRCERCRERIQLKT
jgi:hypothetical protein